MTINEGMVLQKTLRLRLASLIRLRDEVAVKTSTTWMIGERDRKEEKEPQYDVKLVDAKIVEIELFLFKLDSKIKQANARTEIDLEANIDSLLAGLQ